MDRFVTVNGLRLHYLERGTADKPALILVHGNERHAHTFDHIAPEFTRDYRVIALDMRGHGDSAWSPEAAYLVEDHVKDLTAVIQELGLKRVTLWGNSTGGRVVQVYAGLNPGMVERVISEDVGPERPEDISGFAKRVAREANGWASEDELVAGTHEAVSTYARSDRAQPGALRHQAPRRRTLHLEARPKPRERLRRDRAVAIRQQDHVADHLRARRREPDRSAGNAREAEERRCPMPRSW